MEVFKIDSPINVARFFEYSCKKKTANKGLKISIVNIQGKTIYRKNTAVFNKLFDISNKYLFSLTPYITFCVNELNILDPQQLISKNTLYKYTTKIKVIEEANQIYKYFLKSVDNVVKECIELNFSTAREYFGYLIKNNKLGEKYVTGKISVYYLSSIHNIEKLIAKMDSLNQDTLKIVSDRRDKFNADLQNAFLLLKSQKVNTLQYTDEQLFSKLTELSATK